MLTENLLDIIESDENTPFHLALKTNEELKGLINQEEIVDILVVPAEKTPEQVEDLYHFIKDLDEETKLTAVFNGKNSFVNIDSNSYTHWAILKDGTVSLLIS